VNMTASVNMDRPRSAYDERRGRLETYFDRTALDAWAQLTSDAPVSRIRATVRAGRDSMRETLLSWLPARMDGVRLFDAGCGTGALSVAAARRGANVIGVDVSAGLIKLAEERITRDFATGSVDFRVGDMLDPRLGRFDHVVAMDSLIHYEAPDIVRVLGHLAASARESIVFTFAPRTRALAAMHAVGRFFPRGDRAPSIVPVAEPTLRHLITGDPSLAAFAPGRTQRIGRGFYISQALEVSRR